MAMIDTIEQRSELYQSWLESGQSTRCAEPAHRTNPAWINPFAEPEQIEAAKATCRSCPSRSWCLLLLRRSPEFAAFEGVMGGRVVCDADTDDVADAKPA